MVSMLLHSPGAQNLRSLAHPLCTTSNLMPLVCMALRKPRWPRLMQSLNCSLNSMQGRREEREAAGSGSVHWLLFECACAACVHVGVTAQPRGQSPPSTVFETRSH